MKRLNRSGGWLVLALLAIALASCQRAPPEARLRQAVADLQAAIEDRDTDSMREALAADFVGPDGLDREGARRLAQVIHLRHRTISVTLGPMQVDVQPGHATVDFTAVVTGGAGGVLPRSGRIYNLRTGWRDEDGRWRLTSAQWDTATD